MALIVAAVATLVPSATPSGAATTATFVRQVGGTGHAGLYGWGAATLADGSVLLGDYWNFRIGHYSTSGQFLGDVVSADDKGSGPGEHLAPYGVAVDPTNDDLYFGDVDGNKTVDKYSSSGSFIREWGGCCNGAGRFNYPSQLAVASNRRVFVSDQWTHNVVAHDHNGVELFAFGTQGTGNGQFRQPRGLGFDAQDRLYVVDNYNLRVQVFDANGTYLSKFGSGGTQAGRFNPGADLRGLAVDKDNGWVYVVDAASGYINKFTTGGQYLLRFGGFGSGDGRFVGGGRDITVDGDGNVWVGDMPGFRFQKFSPSGQFLLAVPSPAQPPPNGGFNAPRGVAVDAAGNIFVTDTHNWRVQKFAANGSFVTAWGFRGGGNFGFNYPRGIAVDTGTGDVVVADTDNHQIKKYSNNGTFLWRVGSFGTSSSQFKNPHSLDVGPDGRIYVVDTQNFRVKVLSSTGATLTTFGSQGNANGQFQFPRGITVDGDGSIWVSDSVRGVVQHFTNSGGYLGRFGSFGTGPEQLARAADVETDGSRVYVADVDSHAVKVWTKAGVFDGTIGSGGKTPGRFLNPHGMDLTPSGRLYVIEQTGERAQEFSLSVA